MRSARSRGTSVRLCAASTYRLIVSLTTSVSLGSVGLGAFEGSNAILRGVATRTEVDRTLRDLVRRLDGADLNGAKLPSETRVIACVITDLSVTYRAEYADGRIRKLRVAKVVDPADVRISVGSDELIALSQGKSSLAMALLFGRIRVDGNARDLMLLRQLF